MGIKIKTIHLQELVELDATQTQIITVNNRFARRVLSYFQQQLKHPGQAMALAEIMPLSAWYQRCEQDLSMVANLVPAAYVLDAFSARQVWEEIIKKNNPLDMPIIDLTQVGLLAYEADWLLDEWQIKVDALEQNDDHQQFLLWRHAYDHYLKENELDDENRSVNRMVRLLEQGKIQNFKKHFVWVGFHEFSPRIQRLQKALQAQGVQQYTLQWPAVLAQDLAVVYASSAEQEWLTAVQWVEEQLEQNPSGRYAIVAPDLESVAPYARRVLDHHFKYAWNMAVGRSLSDWPQVRHMLAWLQLLNTWHDAYKKEGKLARVSPKLLGSALLGDSFFSALLGLAGTKIDARWRLKQVLSVSFSEWEEALAKDAGHFYATWQKTWALLTGFNEQNAADRWAEKIRTLLKSLGLPSEPSIDSVSYQVLMAFERQLNQFAQYGVALGPLSFKHAVRIFNRLCQEVTFQPEHDPKAQLDVLGMLEAEGGRWDGVWVLGLTDQAFPAAPKPNPLIPYSALARAGAPRATPERELAWAQLSFQQLLHSAPKVRLSAPKFKDEELLQPSPLIRDYPISDYCYQLARPVQLPTESIIDNQAPKIDFSKEDIRGGSSLIDTQARNPQWAFVRYRLKAQQLPAYASLGQSQILGSYIHMLLERVWQGMPQPDQMGLKQWLQTPYAHQSLESISTQVKDELLQEYPKNIAEIIRQWALQVVHQWLHFESKREIGFLCSAAERQMHYELKGLNLNLRVDRIDQLTDGRYVVIDYKTSAHASLPKKQWLRPRPVELQLPLYASLMQHFGQPVAAVAIAKVNIIECALDGLGLWQEDNLDDPDGIKLFDSEVLSWSQQLQVWHEYINQLINELLNGQADNSFYDVEDLAYCDALPFLRITEHGEFYER